MRFFPAMLYETEESKVYLLESKIALDAITESERVPTVYVHVNDQNQIVFTYYLQGYETQKLQNLLGVFHNRLAGHDVIELIRINWRSDAYIKTVSH